MCIRMTIHGGRDDTLLSEHYIMVTMNSYKSKPDNFFDRCQDPQNSDGYVESALTAQAILLSSSQQKLIFVPLLSHFEPIRVYRLSGGNLICPKL